VTNLEIALESSVRIDTTDSLLSLKTMLAAEKLQAPEKWRQAIAFMLSLADFKLQWLKDLHHRYPTAQLHQEILLTGRTYTTTGSSGGTRTGVVGVRFTVSVAVPGRSESFQKTYDTEYPAKLYGSPAWVSPEPPLAPSALLKEIRMWLAAG
jgi:hypothetical protein